MRTLNLLLAFGIFGSILLSFQTHTANTGAFIASWNHFKRAMKDADFERTATYFNFPVVTDDNEIWLLAKDFPEDMDTLIGEGPREFNRSDLKQYYKHIFDDHFRTFAQQINASVLIKTHEIQLQPMVSGDTTYNFKATLSLNNSQLTLLYSQNFMKQDVLYEKDVAFDFVLTPEERLKITGIQIAD